jgi:hypothetical protein
MKYCIFILFLLVVVSACRKNPTCSQMILSPKNNAVYHSGDTVPLIISYSNCKEDSECISAQKISPSYGWTDTPTYLIAFLTPFTGSYYQDLIFFASGNKPDTVSIQQGWCVHQTIGAAVNIYIQP